MTILVKVGRRIHRNEDRRWFSRQISNMKNTVSIQQFIWKNIEYGIKLATIKMNKEIKKNAGNSEYIFKYTKRKFKEEEGLHYNIEWIELIMEGTDIQEQEEYDQSLKFFDKLGNNPVFNNKKDKLEIDPDLSKAYEKKLKGKKAKNILQKGFDKAKDITISKALNDVGIITIVEKIDKEEIKDE